MVQVAEALAVMRCLILVRLEHLHHKCSVSYIKTLPVWGNMVRADRTQLK